MNDRVPAELLVKIFKFSVPQRIAIPWVFAEVDLPWALFRVCRKWRSMVLRMPELWTSILLDFEDDPSSRQDDDIDPQRLTAIARTILARSQNALISLSIVCDLCDWADWKPLISLITLHAHHFRCLRLNLFGGALRGLLALSPLNFERLEYLSVVSSEEGCEGIKSVTFQNAPHLVAVELGIGIEWILETPRLPWANLTDLAMTAGEDMSPIIAHMILQECSRLVTLEITLFTDHTPSEMVHVIPPITFPHLKTLLVQLSLCNVVADFLRPLSLPSLTRLHITHPSELSPRPRWDRSAVFSMIVGFPKLKTLKITLPIPGQYNMRAFLTAIPNITNLSLASLPPLSTILLGKAECLPHLETLSVSVTKESIGRFLIMLDKRAEGGYSTHGTFVLPSFKALENYNPSGAEKHLVEKLKDMKLLEITCPNEMHMGMRYFATSHVQRVLNHSVSY